ncbi:MAG: quinone oxidoreductase [Burkholderiaceae bacterium]
MTDAIVVREYGGPEVLRLEQVDVPAPGPGELRIRQTCLGVNFHDVYVRSGLYRTLSLPGTPGIEGVGIVEHVGEGVTGFAKGDRIGYVTNTYGCYAAERIIPAAIAVRLPDEVDDLTAGAVLLKGLTVEMLVRRVYRVQAGDRVLVHAAAGGVGQLLVQAAARIGARVIGTVGSEAKAELARRCGCEHVVLYRSENFVERVRELTEGRGVQVVYDSVGKDTFFGSLDSLAVRGHLVNFGQSSGPVAGFEVSALAPKSASLTRPMLFHYMQARAELLDMSGSLFEALRSGTLKVEPPRSFALSEAARAHEVLESRESQTPLVLLPG